MHCSQCYWETFPTGCQKKACGFYHMFPRNIQGLFLPPSSDIQEKRDITHHIPMRVIIYLMDDKEDDEEELDDSNIEKRVKTHEEEEEENAILSACRSAGAIFSISTSEDNKEHEAKTCEGNIEKRVEAHEKEEEEEKAILSACRSAGAILSISIFDNNKEPKAKTSEGGDNCTQEPPNTGDAERLGPTHEKGQGEQKSTVSSVTPVQTDDSDKNLSCDLPCNHERSTYQKGPQQYYRGNYKKDGPRWRKKYWYSDHEPWYNAQKEDYGPAKHSAIPGQTKDCDTDKNPSSPHDPPSKPDDRSTYWNKPQHYYRGDYKKQEKRWKKKYWYSDYEPQYNAEKGDSDNYQPHRKPSRKAWRKTYVYEESHTEDQKPTGQGEGINSLYINDHQQADSRHPGNSQKNRKKKSGEKKKDFTSQYEYDQKSADSYHLPYKPLGRGRRKGSRTYERNNGNDQPFKKPYAETREKAIEK